jgi:uncharacterized membrane protein
VFHPNARSDSFDLVDQHPPSLPVRYSSYSNTHQALNDISGTTVTGPSNDKCAWPAPLCLIPFLTIAPSSIRILYMPPVYAIISFFSYRFFRKYTYYVLIEVAYEAVTLSAFL